jgi:hypothetical protein
MEKLFPDDGKVLVDTWYKEKMENLRYKWNPPILLKKIWEEMDKSIVNPKGEIKDKNNGNTNR